MLVSLVSKNVLELNSIKFLDTNLTNVTNVTNINLTKPRQKKQNYLHHGPPKLQNVMNEIQSMVIFILQKEYHQTLKKRSL